MATIATAPEGADPRAQVTPRPLVIVGGGEHARVVADAARSRPDQWRLAGFTDPDGDLAPGPDLPYLGDDRTFSARLATMRPEDRPALILGFGGPLGQRRRTAATFGPDASWATVIHASAWVSPSAEIGPGAVVMAGVAVNAGARIGAHAIVNTHAVVEHDVRLGAGSHVAPGAIVGGGSTIGEEAMIGLGAAVRDHVSLGDRVVVGMGAVVVADLADDVTVMGVPARVRASADA